MTLFLWIGTALGATFGLLHGVYLYREIAARAAAGISGFDRRGLYYAAWTLALWTVFGAYVLTFWLIGAIANALLHLRRRRNAS